MSHRPLNAYASLICAGALSLSGACSKGGAPTDNNNNKSCARLIDLQNPGMTGTPQDPLPTALYAELRNDAAGGGTVLPVMLDGLGGSYSGKTRAVMKCDAPGTYYVDRLVLVDALNRRMATARRVGSNYQVSYEQGGTTTLSASGFTRYYAGYSIPSGATLPTLTSMSASASTARQGDRITVTAAAGAAADDCGMKSISVRLTNTPGGSAYATAVIQGGQGSAPLRIPPTLTVGSYYLEVTLTSQSNRTTTLHGGATTYRIYNPSTGSYTSTTIPVARVEVTTNPMPDQKNPEATGLSSSARVVTRCQQVTLSLNLSDDQGLPASQEVKLWLGTFDQPRLVSTLLSGSGGTVSGTFTVPMDAPAGTWLAYPESIQDAAGNVATGSLSGNRFTVSGSSMQVQAELFFVEAPDGPMLDGGTPPPVDASGTLPDLRMDPGLPALTNIEVMPTTLVADMPVTVNVTWVGQGIK